ncbi:hypothetical protein EYC84_009357 [Monilinia fructicola]|uniref:Phosphatidic acid phosphatase type 2/haloperoxidase domain-containing protein n=1 Tax=Monilinia fructicola TaxID=38448 RepID=A0A5M9J7D2_MONFR|nr:hypothetical protein EYC84_009357 [Monilinia fructicola]
MFSLPRPLSPPLHRITMSGSAALEYGFPSTHSANAVSVAVYALFTLHSPECQLLPTTKLALEMFVAFAAVMIGVEFGGWHYASGGWAWNVPVPATVPFDLNHMGWTIVILRVIIGDYFASKQSSTDDAVTSGMSMMHGGTNLPTPAQSRVGSYEQMMGAGHVIYAAGVTTPGIEGNDAQEDEITVGQGNELDETEMFSRLEKPRVRYDVEVVTKLVVYSGIAWLAVEGNPIIFEIIGLGMGV